VFPALIDETVRRRIDEHWRATAAAAVHRNRDADPEGWSNYLAEADELAVAYAPVDGD
jgi:hypothetical protein